MTAKTVLIVEDQAFMRAVLQETLATFVEPDVVIQGCSSGNRAIAFLSEQPNNVRLMLLDMKMDDGDGLTVLNYLAKHNLLHIPVYIISSLEPSFIDFVMTTVGELEVRIAGFIPKQAPSEMHDRLGQYKSKFLSYIYHDTATDPIVDDATAIDVDSRSILERLEEELVLYVQPKFELSNRSVIGFEILSRIADDELGVLTPDLFFPYLDSIDKRVQFNWIVLERVFDLLSSMQQRGLYIALSINLSAEVLSQDDFPEVLEKQRHLFAIDLTYITLELTDIPAELPHSLLRNIAQLKLSEIRFCLDNFGKGTANLDCLQRIPFDEVKLDKLFITDIATSENSRRLVEGYIPLLQEKGMEITAHGLENAATLAVLREIGCTQGQGYYFAIPEPAFEIDKILMNSFRPRMIKIFNSIDAETVNRLYETFFSETRCQLDGQIKQSQQNQDSLDVSDFCHTLKGSLKTAGIYEGLALIDQFEHTGDASHLQRLQFLLHYYQKAILAVL